MINWIKSRLNERSTWAGIALIAGSVLTGPLGFSYADFKDAVLAALFGIGLVGVDTSGGK